MFSIANIYAVRAVRMYYVCRQLCSIQYTQLTHATFSSLSLERAEIVLGRSYIKQSTQNDQE